jgi:hypothetical protein
VSQTGRRPDLLAKGGGGGREGELQPSGKNPSTEVSKAVAVGMAAWCPPTKASTYLAKHVRGPPASPDVLGLGTQSNGDLQ